MPFLCSCGEKTQVIDSDRGSVKTNFHRLRKCASCGRKFDTYESLHPTRSSPLVEYDEDEEGLRRLDASIPKYNI